MEARHSKLTVEGEKIHDAEQGIDGVVPLSTILITTMVVLR